MEQAFEGFRDDVWLLRRGAYRCGWAWLRQIAKPLTRRSSHVAG